MCEVFFLTIRLSRLLFRSLGTNYIRVIEQLRRTVMQYSQYV